MKVHTPVSYFCGVMQIIFEDNHLIAVNKPQGILVHSDASGDKPLSDLIKLYIKDRYNKPGDVFLGVIHRLDRPVSGVIIFARTSKALARMNKLFSDREVEKTYLAVVGKRPSPLSGKLKHYILKDEKKNLVKAFLQKSNRSQSAKEAQLEYQLLGELGNNFLLKINPHTGRPHQIRAQLAKAGYPIKGDLKYGYPQPNQNGCINLHCSSLSFIHPVKNEKVTIMAQLPNEQVWNLFREFV